MDVSTERAGVDFLPPVLCVSVVSHMRYANEDLTSADNTALSNRSSYADRLSRPTRIAPNRRNTVAELSLAV